MKDNPDVGGGMGTGEAEELLYELATDPGRKYEVTPEEQAIIDAAKSDREQDLKEDPRMVTLSIWYHNGVQALRVWVVDHETAEVMKAHFFDSRKVYRAAGGLVGRYPIEGKEAELMLDWSRIDQVLFEEEDIASGLFDGRMREAYTFTNRELDEANVHRGEQVLAGNSKPTSPVVTILPSEEPRSFPYRERPHPRTEHERRLPVNRGTVSPREG